jgi:hypothetical protein
MTFEDAELDRLIATAELQGLSVREEWRAAVRANLRVTLARAAEVAAFPLPDTVEPAPVFVA